MHEVYQNKQNATFEQRIVAYVIDFTILGALSQIPYGSLLVFPLYYVGLQYYLGYTPGKYIVGLRVIFIDDKGSLLKMIGRETIGRFISAIFLCAGYFAILFSNSRQSWHDSLSGTRVITLRDQNVGRGMQILRGSGALIAFTILLGTYGVYQSLYSTALLTSLTKSAAGLDFEGARGSLSSGYQIDKIHFDGNGVTAVLEDVSIVINRDLPFIKKIDFKKNFILDSFHARSGKIKIDLSAKKDMENFISQKKLDKKVNNAKDTPSKPSKKLFNLAFKSIEIENFTLQIEGSNYLSPDGQPTDIIIERLSLANFLPLNENSVTVDHIYLGSSAGDLMLKDFLFNKQANRTTFALSGLLKKDNPFFSQQKVNWDFQSKIEMENKKLVEINLTAFAKKLKFQKRNSNFQLSLQNWTPNHFIKKKVPFSNITTTFGPKRYTASLKYRGKRIFFKSSSSADLLQRDLIGRTTDNQQVKIKPSYLFAPLPWFYIGDDRLSSLPLTNNSLSQFLAKKDYTYLTSNEKRKINSDMQFFSKGPFFTIALGLQALTQKMRQPTSTTKPIGTPLSE